MLFLRKPCFFSYRPTETCDLSMLCPKDACVFSMLLLKKWFSTQFTQKSLTLMLLLGEPMVFQCSSYVTLRHSHAEYKGIDALKFQVWHNLVFSSLVVSFVCTLQSQPSRTPTVHVAIAWEWLQQCRQILHQVPLKTIPYYHTTVLPYHRITSLDNDRSTLLLHIILLYGSADHSTLQYRTLVCAHPTLQ